MTSYWIDIAGCRRVISELREITEASNDFQWVDNDLWMVDRHTYAAQESANTKSDAEKVDTQFYAFLEDKLEPTYDSMVQTLKNCIDAMDEAVEYYASGDAAMAYEASDATSDFPEYRSADGSSTSQYPTPDDPGSTDGPTEPATPMPSYPDPNDPLGNQHYVKNPYEASVGSRG